MRIAILFAITLLMAGCASDMDDATVSIEGLDQDISETFSIDVGTKPTADMYHQNAGAHPDFYNAHDLLYDFSKLHGHDFEFTYFDESWGSGFFLSSIDGVPGEGESKYWQVQYNGESSALGITDLEIHAGDELSLVLTSF